MPTVRKIPPPTADEPDDRPADFPTLTRGDVHAWVGETMLQRGAPYVGDALFNLRRTGRALKARCQGTASQPYRVEATIKAEGGIERDDCTCPVGGRCKHVAALLLAWLDDPDAFAEVAETEVDTALEGRSKAELIALIHQMLARFPELESLLSMPLPVADARLKPADPALIRREVVGAFRDQLTGASSGGRQDVTKGGLVRTAQRDRSPGRRWQALSRENEDAAGRARREVAVEEERITIVRRRGHGRRRGRARGGGHRGCCRQIWCCRRCRRRRWRWSWCWRRRRDAGANNSMCSARSRAATPRCRAASTSRSSR
jgi:hypothetical protein